MKLTALAQARKMIEMLALCEIDEGITSFYFKVPRGYSELRFFKWSKGVRHKDKLTIMESSCNGNLLPGRHEVYFYPPNELGELEHLCPNSAYSLVSVFDSIDPADIVAMMLSEEASVSLPIMFDSMEDAEQFAFSVIFLGKTIRTDGET